MKAKLHKTHHGVDGEPFAIVELHDRVPVEERAGSELRIEEVFRALFLKPARSDDWNLAVRRFLNPSLYPGLRHRTQTRRNHAMESRGLTLAVAESLTSG